MRSRGSMRFRADGRRLPVIGWRDRRRGIGRLTILAATLLVTSAAGGSRALRADEPMAARIDALLLSEVRETGANHRIAPLTGDVTFARRAYLDLVGRPPTPEELRRFVSDEAADKRSDLVDRLLDDPDFGVNWGAYWRDVIFYRRSEDRSLLAAAATRDFLAEQLNENRPWNEIAEAFITAEGDVRENGATGLIMAQGGRPEETVAEISRIFLGIQIQCAQCHDHPTDQWTRRQFHELAAFFPRVAVRPQLGGERRTFLVVATDRPMFRRPPMNNNRFRGTPEHFMPDLDEPDSRGQLMRPVFFASGDALRVGAPDAERRESLARWLPRTEQNWFARAYVNRIWSELVGEGFCEPVDDLGPNRPTSAPRTFDYLAERFAESGYDVKQLFRAIMATEAYQRESRPRREADEPPFLANRPQRLRADPLYRSLRQALGVPELAGRRQGAYGGRFGAEALFNQTFGYDPSQPRDEIAGSVPQALFMMNSPLLQRAIDARRPLGLGGLLWRVRDDRELVTRLYLRTLSREPSGAELRASLAHFRQIGDRPEAVEDLAWALVNSAEFLHRP